MTKKTRPKGCGFSHCWFLILFTGPVLYLFIFWLLLPLKKKDPAPKNESASQGRLPWARFVHVPRTMPRVESCCACGGRHAVGTIQDVWDSKHVYTKMILTAPWLYHHQTTVCATVDEAACGIHDHTRVGNTVNIRTRSPATRNPGLQQGRPTSGGRRGGRNSPTQVLSHLAAWCSLPPHPHGGRTLACPPAL